MKKLLESILAFFAKRVVKKYKPKVVGITGSIGKTSAKEAVFCVLDGHFRVRQNIKNYNNELGVPLTIIGAESGGSNPIAWLNIFVKAINLLITEQKDYPEILVLEMGADKPGDIEYLVKIAPCFVGVLTKISPTHLEAFKTIEAVAKEKEKIFTFIGKDGFAVVNFDDERVVECAEHTEAKVISYGFGENAAVRALDLTEMNEQKALIGLKFKIQHEGNAMPAFMPGVIGAHGLYAGLAASGVGLAFGLNLIQVSDGLKKYHAPKGRMNVIAGLKESLIIDDTYNSSPDAAMAAVETLKNLNIIGINRKVAVFGDMLELGSLSEEAHLSLGKKAAEAGIRMLVCAGTFRSFIAEGAKSAGLNGQNIFQFETSELAGQAMPNLLQSGDLILVKGSQGSRMERVVKAIMKNPSDAADLLVRQGAEWC
jgi:UDP-N-acetylmuramoyl-tripeptide--D-alanyl-D-alanine ligase